MGFQVDIEIYEDKLSQSGDRILSSHIRIYHIGLCNIFFQGEQHLTDKIVWSQRNPVLRSPMITVMNL